MRAATFTAGEILAVLRTLVKRQCWICRFTRRRFTGMKPMGSVAES